MLTILFSMFFRHLSGLTNFFYVALGEHQNAAGTQDSNKLGNIYNYAAKYDNGNFSIMGSYLYRNVAMGPTKDASHNQYLNFAVSYDFGVTKPVFQFTKKFASNEAVQDKFWMAQLGTSTPLWGGQVDGFSFLHEESDKR